MEVQIIGGADPKAPELKSNTQSQSVFDELFFSPEVSDGSSKLATDTQHFLSPHFPPIRHLSIEQFSSSFKTFDSIRSFPVCLVLGPLAVYMSRPRNYKDVDKKRVRRRERDTAKITGMHGTKDIDPVVKPGTSISDGILNTAAVRTPTISYAKHRRSITPDPAMFHTPRSIQEAKTPFPFYRSQSVGRKSRTDVQLECSPMADGTVKQETEHWNIRLPRLFSASEPLVMKTPTRIIKPITNIEQVNHVPSSRPHVPHIRLDRLDHKKSEPNTSRSGMTVRRQLEVLESLLEESASREKYRNTVKRKHERRGDESARRCKTSNRKLEGHYDEDRKKKAEHMDDPIVDSVISRKCVDGSNEKKSDSIGCSITRIPRGVHSVKDGVNKREDILGNNLPLKERLQQRFADSRIPHMDEDMGDRVDNQSVLLSSDYESHDDCDGLVTSCPNTKPRRRRRSIVLKVPPNNKEQHNSSSTRKKLSELKRDEMSKKWYVKKRVLWSFMMLGSVFLA